MIPKGKRFGPNGRKILAWIPATGFLGVFFFFPLASILLRGWQVYLDGGDLGYPIQNILHVTGFTIGQAGLSTLLTLMIGLPGAYVLSRFVFPGRDLIRVLTAVPFVVPTVVAAAGLDALLGQRGLLVALAGILGLPPPQGLIPSYGALLLAHVFYNTSIVLRMVGTAWGRIDTRLTESASVLGAGRYRVFREITLPLLWPSILAASILVFLFDFTSFGVVLILAGPQFSTLEVEIYTQAMQMLNLPAAALLSMIQMVFTLTAAAATGWISHHGEYSSRQQSSETGIRKARSLRDRILVTGVVAAMMVLIVIPLAAPAARSVLSIDPQKPGWTFTAQYYHELWENRRNSFFYIPPLQAAGNSLRYAVMTAVFALGLGLPIAASMARPARWERGLEPLLLLPLGTSSVTLGLGMLVGYSEAGAELLRSTWLLPAAHTVLALPFVVRALRTAFAAIPERTREAARLLGASSIQVWMTIDLPIAARAILSAGAFAFAISLGEFGATTFLARPESATLPLAVFRFLSQPGALSYGQAMASATILLALCACSIAIMEKLRTH